MGEACTQHRIQDGGMDVKGCHVPLALALAIRILGRALVGALAGLIVVPLVLIIATDYFRFSIFEDSASGDRAFRTIIGLGVVAFALVAVICGKAEIGGRTGAAVKGMLAGAIAGIIAGAMLGPMAAPGMPRKGGVTLGIFLGGPLGAIFGCVIGAHSKKPAGSGALAVDRGLMPDDARG